MPTETRMLKVWTNKYINDHDLPCKCRMLFCKGRGGRFNGRGWVYDMKGLGKSKKRKNDGTSDTGRLLNICQVILDEYYVEEDGDLYNLKDANSHYSLDFKVVENPSFNQPEKGMLSWNLPWRNNNCYAYTALQAIDYFADANTLSQVTPDFFPQLRNFEGEKAVEKLLESFNRRSNEGGEMECPDELITYIFDRDAQLEEKFKVEIQEMIVCDVCDEKILLCPTVDVGISLNENGQKYKSIQGLITEKYNRNNINDNGCDARMTGDHRQKCEGKSKGSFTFFSKLPHALYIKLVSRQKNYRGDNIDESSYPSAPPEKVKFEETLDVSCYDPEENVVSYR